MDAPPTEPLPRRWTLRRKFARLLVLVGLLPALLFGSTLLATQYRYERARLADRLAINSRLNAAAFDDFLAGQLAGVSLLADRVGPRAPDWPAELAALRAHYPALLTVLVTDASGRALHAQPATRLPAGMEHPVVADRDYFRVPRATGRAYISDAFLGRGLGHDPLVAVAAPLRREGRFDGIVEGSIRVDTFAGLRASALRQRHFSLLLVDRNGHTVYAGPELPFRFLQPVPAALLAGMPAAPGGDGALLRMDGLLADAGDALVGRARMRNGWALLLVAPARDLWTPIMRGGVLMLALVVVVSVGVVAASWWQTRLLGDGLERLLQSLRGFALGEPLELRRVRAMPQELQPLAGAVGDLSERLNHTYDELRAALARQRELSASLREAVDAREQQVAERTEELRAAVAELDRLSRTDGLTGCLNYRGFHETLRRLWREMRDEGAPLSVLALDIDRFKAYNDRYGHQLGDSALQRFAGAVRSALLGPEDMLARQGGEEFLVFLPRATLDQALHAGERVVAAVRAAGIPHADSPSGVLTVSIGAATSAPGDDADALIARADAALYRAKHDGRDRVRG